MWSVFVILACWICLSVDGGVDYSQSVNRGRSLAMSDEKRLIKHMLENYDKVGLAGRPVYNTTEIVPVKINFYLMQVLDLDPDSQVFDFVGMVMMSWDDILLTWAPKDFGGVVDIVVPWKKIWTPGVLLQNSIETIPTFDQRDAKVSSDGHVKWAMQYRCKTSCKMNPGTDSVKCRLRFGPWAYAENQVSLQYERKRMDTSFYTPNHIWQLKSAKAKKSSHEYPCCPHVKYGHVAYSLKFQRRP